MENTPSLPDTLKDITCMGMSNIQELADFIKDPDAKILLLADGLPQHMILALTEVVLDLDHDEFTKMFQEQGLPIVQQKVDEARVLLNLQGSQLKRLLIESVERMSTFGLEAFVKLWRKANNSETGPDYLVFFDPDVRGMLERVTGKSLDSYIINRDLH